MSTALDHLSKSAARYGDGRSSRICRGTHRCGDTEDAEVVPVTDEGCRENRPSTLILVKLRGGLSNQMFQYAAAKRLAVVHDTSVLIDATWYRDCPQGATPRRYELADTFQITGEPARFADTVGTDGVRNARALDLPFALWRKAFPRFKFVPESHFHFDPSMLNLPDGVCLFGYYFSEKYFEDVQEVIRGEFRFRREPSEQNRQLMSSMAAEESVSIHVRRGDYATNPEVNAIHGLCDIDYYTHCVCRIRQQLRDPAFYVFSDDLDWVADNLDLGVQATVLSNNRGADSAEDLRLMSACRHNIIANSGFSWWGAWLNPNPSKIVYAPRRWMRSEALSSGDVVPSTWTLG